jgi:hypothetical protein
MDVEDSYPQGKRWWFQLREEGGKHHEMPAYHKAEEYMDGGDTLIVPTWCVASVSRTVAHEVCSPWFNNVVSIATSK